MFSRGWFVERIEDTPAGAQRRAAQRVSGVAHQRFSPVPAESPTWSFTCTN
jgi:hypothetical protein